MKILISPVLIAAACDSIVAINTVWFLLGMKSKPFSAVILNSVCYSTSLILSVLGRTCFFTLFASKLR